MRPIIIGLLFHLVIVVKAQDPAYPPVPNSALNIIKAEYFIDFDPGFGLGTNIPITAGLDITSLEATINTTGLSKGDHKLYLRTLNAEGEWSNTLSRTFFYEENPPYILASALSLNIVKAEYFIDSDPGFGVGTPISLTQATDIPALMATINTSGLSKGDHKLHIRTFNNEGEWSNTLSRTFFYEVNPPYAATPPSLMNIVKAEYFIGNDPGIGLGINIPLTAAVDIPSLIVSINTMGLDQGTKRLSIRTLNAEGEWSVTSIRSYLVNDDYVYPDTPPPPSNITEIEYFFDSDPGFENGNSIAVTPSTNITNLTLSVNTLNVSPGFHKMYVRSKGSNWSHTSVRDVELIAMWYKDQDMDGYGNTDSLIVSSSQPSGYILTNGDCDDNDPLEKPGQQWFINADGDDFGGSSIVQCLRPQNGYVLSELSGTGTDDCNDNDPLQYPGLIWYIDQDGDGYGSDSLHQCMLPVNGFQLSNLLGTGLDDCNDNNASVNPGEMEVCDATNTDEDCNGLANNLDPNATGKTIWYKDNDNDSYGNPSMDTLVCNPPSMYVNNNQDCNDVNRSLNLDCSKYRVGINTTQPKAILHVADSSVVFTGFNTLPSNPAKPPIEGPGNRFMWYPDKAALRIGGVSGGKWNRDSIGLFSFATGYDVQASGNASFASGKNNISAGHASAVFGQDNLASGDYAVAFGYKNRGVGEATVVMGEGNIAYGDASIAMGFLNESKGNHSLATGYFNKTKGNASTAFGYFNVAKGYSCFVLGSLADSTSLASENSPSALSPLFIIGNGLSFGNEKNAMTILKNGLVGLNTSNPKSLLTVYPTSGSHNDYIRLSNNSQEARLSYFQNKMRHSLQFEDDSIFYKNQIDEDLLVINNQKEVRVENHITTTGIIIKSPDSIAIVSDNVVVSAIVNSYIKLYSNSTIESDRTIILSNASIKEGQLLLIESTSTSGNKFEILDTGNANLENNITMSRGDILKLIYNGNKWVQVSYSKNF